MNESLSLSSLIENNLSKIVKNYFYQSMDFKYLSNINFAVNLVNNQNIIIYKSSLALQWAKLTNKSTLFIAQNLVNIFNESNFTNDISIKISTQGWLEFIIGDRLINNWLNNLNKITFLKLDNTIEKNQNYPIKFENYYIHARCCSILTSAHQQNIIKLNNLEFKLNKWYREKPKDINYQILLTKNYEGKLIKELIIIIDKLDKNKLNYLTSLNNLRGKILDVECYSRIWGETLAKNKTLSISRLDLIALSLKFYQYLFYHQFKQNLPSEI